MARRAKWLAFLTMLFLPATCSVKEDRDPCPCLLTIDTGEAVEGGIILNLVHSIKGTVSREKVDDISITTEVPRGMVCVTAVGNSDGWEFSADGLSISLPEGTEPGRIYAHSSTVDCGGEEARDSVVMRKQWCTIGVMIDDPEQWEGFDFVIEGGWNGFSLVDFSAIEGSFSCTMRRVDENYLEARVTRQGDNGLTLRISDGDQEDRLRALGEAIRTAGYNWEETSLDDITLALSDSAMDVYLNASDWGEGQNNEDPIL